MSQPTYENYYYFFIFAFATCIMAFGGIFTQASTVGIAFTGFSVLFIIFALVQAFLAFALSQEDETQYIFEEIFKNVVAFNLGLAITAAAVANKSGFSFSLVPAILASFFLMTAWMNFLSVKGDEETEGESLPQLDSDAGRLYTEADFDSDDDGDELSLDSDDGDELSLDSDDDDELSLDSDDDDDATKGFNSFRQDSATSDDGEESITAQLDDATAGLLERFESRHSQISSPFEGGAEAESYGGGYSSPEPPYSSPEPSYSSPTPVSSPSWSSSSSSDYGSSSSSSSSSDYSSSSDSSSSWDD